MFKQLKLKGQKGFTLIELMIVVAIIGILAAIAIPNFLQYQMKSRQAEAKTNLQAIRTSNISFQAERGCYLGVNAEGAAAPLAAVKSISVPWGLGVAPVGALNFCIPGGTFLGNFRDIGFVSTGATYYRYIIQADALGGLVPPLASCVIASTQATAAGAVPQPGFYVTAASNLDADNLGPTTGISIWGASNDNGAADCTVGQF